MSNVRTLLMAGALLTLAGSSLLSRAGEQRPDGRATHVIQAALNLADAQKLAPACIDQFSFLVVRHQRNHAGG